MKLSFFYKVSALLGTLVFFALVFVSSAQDATESGKNLFLDFDQDGLSNDEEGAYGTDSYSADTDKDGYSDYVEISGGYNPLKPAPGDRVMIEKELDSQIVFPEDGKNVTEEAGTKIAGMIQSGITEGEDVTLADVDKMVQGLVEKGAQDIVLPEIETDRIKVKKQSYKKLSDDEKKEKIKEDAQEYVTAVSYIFAVQFPQLTSGKKEHPTVDVENMLSGVMTSVTSGDYSKLEEISVSGEKAVEQLFETEVPETLLDLHIRALQLANYSQEIKNNLKDQTNDPLAGISNLSLAQGLIVTSQEFFLDLESRLKELGVSDVLADITN